MGIRITITDEDYIKRITRLAKADGKTPEEEALICAHQGVSRREALKRHALNKSDGAAPRKAKAKVEKPAKAKAKAKAAPKAKVPSKAPKAAPVKAKAKVGIHVKPKAPVESKPNGAATAPLEEATAE